MRRPLEHDRNIFMVKRSFDIVAAATALVILTPLLIVITIALLLLEGPPVFYRSPRIGRFGKPFKMIKFRTMVPDAERQGKVTRKDDRRITWLGQILRDFKMDELPQLINVLKGEMSLVGPRPQFLEYTPDGDQADLIATLRPGITDWASIKFRDLDNLLAQADDPERYYLDVVLPEKTRLQAKYANEHSLWLDLRLLGQTMFCVLRKPR